MAVIDMTEDSVFGGTIAGKNGVRFGVSKRVSNRVAGSGRWRKPLPEGHLGLKGAWRQVQEARSAEKRPIGQGGANRGQGGAKRSQ
jgi:hypothetical protein